MLVYCWYYHLHLTKLQNSRYTNWCTGVTNGITDKNS